MLYQSIVLLWPQIIPTALRWATLNPDIGLRWALISAGIIVTLTIPVALLLRPITTEQLHLIEEERKKEAAAKAQAQAQASNTAPIELAEQKKDPETATPEPKVVTTNEDVVNDPAAREKLLTPTGPGAIQSAPAAAAAAPAEPKKVSKVAGALAYFKLMPPLFTEPIYLIHAVHFAVIYTLDNIFLTITFDDFTNVCINSYCELEN